MNIFTDPRFRCILGAIVFTCSGFTAGFGQTVSFSQDIFPILSDRCFACHGPDADKRKANLRLDQTGGKDGAYRTHKGSTAIKPSSVEDSELWYRIISDDEDEIMPPPDAHKKALTEKERALFKRWIENGAVYERFWAFVRAKKTDPPKVKDQKWSDQPIDRYVLTKLESLGLRPSPDTDKRTLIRRVTFDLTGLPPTQAEIKAFLNDKSDHAYESLVDRLLSKKQYGEHVARYWLDLVRFADSAGMHKDFFRDFSPYRTWVIKAFNENLSYDDFLRYQLAGDLYPDASNDQLVASSFNRLHLIIDRGTALPEESFYKNVVDRVTAVGTTFMGMTVHCSSCHDHKYDPLTRKDFYSLYAFFNNIDADPETRGRPRLGLQPPFVSLGTAEQNGKLNELDKQIAQTDNAMKVLKKKMENEKDSDTKKSQAKELKTVTAKRNALKKERDRLDATIPRSMVMRERKEIRPSHIMKRGQYDDPGELVTRNTPEFLHPLKKKEELATRMDLAEWFVDPLNPLTARVAVNRFWQQFFGVGLVKTSEDLGAQGDVPSHPRLLNHLTISFLESGWDVKALMKQIVMSKTYCQSSIATPEQFAKDSQNRLLSRGSRYRMDAEMIRDQILATSGLLVGKMYGKSVKPPQPDGLWKSVTMTGEVFRPDSGDAIYRRSLYSFWKRGMPPPQMTILNAPIRDSCTARRERTNTSSQALLLLNESEFLKAARNLARKTLTIENADLDQRLDFAYETVTSKLPDAKERSILSNLVKNLQSTYLNNQSLANELSDGIDSASKEEKAELAAWTVLVNSLYNLDVTKTRE